jgi:phosphinothricin acetyltransferase
MTAADWPAVGAIYGHGVAAGNAPFEAAPPNWETFDAQKLDLGRLMTYGPRAGQWSDTALVERRAV